MIFLTIALFAMLFMLTFVKFKFMLKIFVFLSPIIPLSVAIYLKENIPLITFHRVGLFIIVIVWLIRIFSKRETKVSFPPAISMFFLYLLFAFVSSYLSEYNFKGIREFFSERVLGSIFVYIISFQTFATEEDIKNVLRLMIISGLVVTLFGLVEYIRQENIFLSLDLIPEEKMIALGFGYFRTRQGMLRIQSSFSHPLDLASYLVFLFPLALTFFTTASGFKRIFYIFVLSSFLIAIYFTVSRGAWIIIALTTFLLTKTKGKAKIFIMMCVLFVIALVLTSWEKEFITEKVAYSYRYYQIKSALLYAIKHPFIGTGLKTFEDYIIVFSPEGEYAPDPMAHVLNVAVETGIVSLILFFATIGTILKKLKKAYYNFCYLNDKVWQEIVLSARVAIWGNLILAVFSISIFVLSQGNLVFWTLAGMLMRLDQIVQRKILINKKLEVKNGIVNNYS
jgi:hypothetical protein